MLSQKLVILVMCGAQSLSPVFSTRDSGSRYSYETHQQSAAAHSDRTSFVPWPSPSDRVRRDTAGAGAGAGAAYTHNSTAAGDQEERIIDDDFLKKQVFLNKTQAQDELIKQNKGHHEDFNFDNDTLHKYYSHTIEQDKNYFYNLDNQNSSGPTAGRVKDHPMLSQSYRRAATINLSFKFPFYGHLVENITIATGGFLYTGDYVHSWLAATQYIAPLMANFDTSSTHNARIRYLDDGDKLIVEWKDVYLQDKSTDGRDGPFTFQVILFGNGNITFAYETIPIDINIITDDDHPVKVGLSDAYIIDRTVYFARRKTIYEYHRLSMKDKPITNKTAILFKSLPTCNTHTDCDSCLAAGADYSYDEPAYESFEDPAHKLECRWCGALGRCSDGTDRNRQEWLKAKCDTYNVSSVQACSATRQPFPGDGGYPGLDGRSQSHLAPDLGGGGAEGGAAAGSRASTGSIVVSLLLTSLVIALAAWVGYAYFNPNSSSGRFLIKYRPGAWRWRQSGARYTAASIHM